MSVKKKFAPYLILSLLLLAVSPMWAQSVSQGTITGTAYLPGNEKAPGVTVSISSPALVTRERTVVSDADGRFVFLSLPPGTYRLTATLSGFKTFSTSEIVLDAGDKREVRVNLQIGAYEEEVVVTGASPIVDTKTSTLDTTFTDEMLEKIPTARNAFYDLALTAPGIAAVGAESSWQPSPSAFGSATNDNMFLVNGVDATSPRGATFGSLVNVNYNTVQEVKILSIGSKAEYGSFSGAAIDVLTKSGSNDFKGDVAYYSLVGEPSDNSTLDFGDDTFFADPALDLNSQPDSSWEGSITLGGPVLRDRLWFYGGINRSAAKTDTPIWQPLIEWDGKLYDLKLTGEAGANHRLWLAYHLEDLFVGNGSWGPTFDPTMRYDVGTDNQTLQAQYQWVINERSILSAKYLGFNTEQSPSTPSDVGKPGWVNWWKWIGGRHIGVSGDHPWIEDQDSNRRTLQADATHYAARFLGEHEVKFGVQHTKGEFNWTGGYFQNYANFAYPMGYYGYAASGWPWNCDSPGCNWMDANGQPWGSRASPVFAMFNRKETLNPFLTVRQSDSTGAFLDDTWTLNDRVTLNLGFRYDRMSSKYGEGAVYEFLSQPSDIDNLRKIRTRAGTDDIFDFSTWSPRIGLAWSLTPDQRTVLRAHYGRYYAPLGVETLRRFGPDMEPGTREVWVYTFPMAEVDLDGNGSIEPNEVHRATRLLASMQPRHLQSRGNPDPSWDLEVESGTDSPHTDQFHISLQRQLSSNLAIEGAFIAKNTRNFIAFRPYNEATGQYWEWEETPFTTFLGHETSAWQVVLKDYNGDGKVDVNDAKFVVNNTAYRAGNLTRVGDKDVKRTYRGVQLVLTKRYAARWQGLASVNWSSTDGMAPRTRNQNQYIDGPMIFDTPFGTSLNHFTNNLEGPLPMTPEWMLKVSGSYTIPVIETDFGLRWRYDSGRALLPTQGLPQFATWMSSTEGVFLDTGGASIIADDPDNATWTPPTSIVDLSVSRGFKIGSGYEVNLSLDVLNAFNESSPNFFGTTQWDFGAVYSIIEPRIFRAGVKFIF